MLGAVSRARVCFVGCAVAAIAVGVVLAARLWWMCDDAFISFRYADHLVRGQGLVFNAGERVEGFTNLLWTLWCAAGLALGVPAETWAGVSGITCFAATVALLARRGWTIARAAGVAWPLPAAAVLAAIHHEATVFATSGLETAAFTFLAVLGYVLATPAADARVGARRRLAAENENRSIPALGRSDSPDEDVGRSCTEARLIRNLAGGAVFALAALTRPDGVLFAAVVGVWLLAGRDLRGALAFAAGFAVAWLPATLWRVAYYGALLPNTYYAKSAAIAWWSQGWFYARIYFARYGVLLLAVPAAAVEARGRAAALELALAAVYTLYVIRVGGDFMFGRLLIPVTPFLLILVERGLVAVAGRRPVVRAAAIAVLGAALVAMPAAVDGHQRPRGIADERDAYMVVLAGWAQRADDNGAALATLFDGLPVSVCFFGAQARLVYRSRVATAIECETGLTDAAIAHQPLVARGRIGHEKHATLAYLLARRVDLVLTRDYANEVLKLDAQLPDVPIDLGRVRGRVISWDPAIMAALGARGVRVPDVPGQIDRYLAGMASLSDDVVRRDWQRFRRLYFDRAPDAAREAAFRARLGE